MNDLKIPFEAKSACVINALANSGELMTYQKLNKSIHDNIQKGFKNFILNNVCGQRFIGAALQGDYKIYIDGIPGNDLGIFMDGPEIFVNGNSEDQVGNTMNEGKIIINGSTGDVMGLSARGGEIYVKQNVGFRIGIHIKEFKGKMPRIVIGGFCKDYLGEYMAGGLLIVLGLKIEGNEIKELDTPIIGNCLASGIHGGVMYIRTDTIPEDLLGLGAKIMEFTEEDKKAIEPYIKNFCTYFNISETLIWNKPFKKVQAAGKRPFAHNYCKDLV
jgi:glutamate synthase domain-containing protein 3